MVQVVQEMRFWRQPTTTSLQVTNLTLTAQKSREVVRGLPRICQLALPPLIPSFWRLCSGTGSQGGGSMSLTRRLAPTRGIKILRD